MEVLGKCTTFVGPDTPFSQLFVPSALLKETVMLRERLQACGVVLSLSLVFEVPWCLLLFLPGEKCLFSSKLKSRCGLGRCDI